MSNIRDLGSKIQSLQNMQKVTRAMNMISSIKLRKHLSALPRLEDFTEAVGEINRALGPSLAGCSHPVVQGHPGKGKEHLVLFTADKGLCGTNNSSVLKAVDSFLSERQSGGASLEYSCFGIKGYNHALREGWDISAFEAMNERTLERETLKKISDEIYDRFLTGEIKRVWIIGKVYKNSLQQDTELKQILPLETEPDPEAAGSGETQSRGPLQTEPEGEQLAEEYGRIYLADTLRCYWKHAFLSEYSARLTAMENATNNSDDMIGKYTTMLNHARQARITNELIEIVSGKEALKG